MFRKVLIANRGEIAARIIRACKAVGAQAVAIYSSADANSPHLKLADESICIGPGPSSDSYLNQEAILQAALQTECQAIHPGFGFLSENARFTQRCKQQGLTFIGPEASHISLMGDKARARETMKAHGVPVLPGSEGLLGSVEDAQTLANEMGYPILLKATAGGGGKGMRICRSADELPALYQDAAREAEKAFGNADLYMEKYIEGGRHIEFQILADHYGQVIHLGERECSIQRNHQKLLEEAPSTNLSPQQRNELGETIVNALREIGYINAGTMEFLMDGDGKLYFMEMNTRIQVEHPVTEMVTGVDLVAWQLRIAAGQALSLKQEDIEIKGHAIECRINAEDPNANFQPQPGLIETYQTPIKNDADGLRFDTHIEEGYKIPPYYDSMIGKMITHGDDRNEAIERMKEALSNTKVIGVPTTINLHQQILRHTDFLTGKYTCQFLGDHLKELTTAPDA
ncbi:MAG: acetyl-CoA carboxylase biotin carboxylase subunit [Myxococcales bacterium]|nr:acetyl-CoA carboxylase biotin carboxylase subunit [Myxococcales bacterium]